MIKHVKDNINKKRENRNQNREAEQRKKIVYKDTIIETPIFRRVSSDEYSEKSGGFLSSIIFLIVAVLCINAGIKNPQLAQILNTFNQKEEDSKASSQIEKMRKIGKEELGKTDGKKYSNGVEEAWCADFITWLKNQVGISDEVIPNFNNCEVGAEFFKKKKRWHYREGYKPKVGDLVFFSWNTQNISYDHVGWVDEVYEEGNETKIKVLNGNWSSKVAITTFNINDSRIIGYGSPDYSKDIVFNTEIKTQKSKGELSLNFIQKEYKYNNKVFYDEKEI